jgi:hypothetical protein
MQLVILIRYRLNTHTFIPWRRSHLVRRLLIPCYHGTIRSFLRIHLASIHLPLDADAILLLEQRVDTLSHQLQVDTLQLLVLDLFNAFVDLLVV